MRFTLLAAASAIGLSAASAASATTVYVIDDFNHAVGDPYSAQLNATKVGGNWVMPAPYTQGPLSYSIAGNAFTRTIVYTLTEDTSSSPNQVGKLNVGPSVLTVTNGSQTNSTLSLAYGIGSLSNAILAGGAGASSTKFTVNFSDGTGNAALGVGPTTINAYLDNVSLGSHQLTQVYDQLTAPGTVSFTLLNGLVDGTDTLRFSFAGPLGYDLTISAITIAVNGNAMPDDVPEPAMLGLFGAGLAGLTFARRRKR